MRRCTSLPLPLPLHGSPRCEIVVDVEPRGSVVGARRYLGGGGRGRGVREVGSINWGGGSRKIAVLLNCRACGVLDMSFLRKVRVGGCDVLKRRRLRGGFSELGAFSTLRLARDCNGDDLVVSAESFSAFYPMVSAPDVAVLLLPKVTPK